MANSKAVLDLEKFKPSTEVMAISEQLESVVGHNPITHAFKVGNLISVIEQWVNHPEVSAIVETMENSPAGFLTDKTAGEKYPAKIRNQCITDALVHGCRLNGNEFNIIAGRSMIVQNGWRRLVQEMGHNTPGGYSADSNYQMQWFHIRPVGEPRIEKNMVTLKMEMPYKMLNKSTGKVEEDVYTMDVTLTIKSRDTVDAWIGKSERRILRDFFRRYSGVPVSDENTAGEFSASAIAGEAGKPSATDSRTTKKRNKSAKAQAAKPNNEVSEEPPAEKPNLQEAEDAEYKESTPEMNEALGQMAQSQEPDAPPAPPVQQEPEQEPQQNMMPPEPKNEPTPPKNPPAGGSKPSMRPQVNF